MDYLSPFFNNRELAPVDITDEMCKCLDKDYNRHSNRIFTTNEEKIRNGICNLLYLTDGLPLSAFCHILCTEKSTMEAMKKRFSRMMDDGYIDCAEMPDVPTYEPDRRVFYLLKKGYCTYCTVQDGWNPAAGQYRKRHGYTINKALLSALAALIRTDGGARGITAWREYRMPIAGEVMGIGNGGTMSRGQYKAPYADFVVHTKEGGHYGYFLFGEADCSSENCTRLMEKVETYVNWGPFSCNPGSSFPYSPLSMGILFVCNRPTNPRGGDWSENHLSLKEAQSLLARLEGCMPVSAELEKKLHWLYGEYVKKVPRAILEAAISKEESPGSVFLPDRDGKILPQDIPEGEYRVLKYYILLCRNGNEWLRDSAYSCSKAATALARLEGCYSMYEGGKLPVETLKALISGLMCCFAGYTMTGEMAGCMTGREYTVNNMSTAVGRDIHAVRGMKQIGFYSIMQDYVTVLETEGRQDEAECFRSDFGTIGFHCIYTYADPAGGKGAAVCVEDMMDLGAWVRLNIYLKGRQSERFVIVYLADSQRDVDAFYERFSWSDEFCRMVDEESIVFLKRDLAYGRKTGPVR